jgi:hypothetical protein
MMWLSFAEKEFEPEFEIALSEDLFDRPCFNCSASERIDLDDSPASADLLAQSVHSMALANAEFVHLPARELLLEQPRSSFLTSENLKHSAYNIVIEDMRLGRSLQ